SNSGFAYAQRGFGVTGCGVVQLLRISPSGSSEMIINDNMPAAGVVGNDPDFYATLGGNVNITSSQGDKAWFFTGLGCKHVDPEDLSSCPTDFAPDRAMYEISPGGLTLLWQDGEQVLNLNYTGAVFLDEPRAN